MADGSHSFDQIGRFMRSLAVQESGNYTQWNGSGSGAYGKYQMIKGTFLQGARMAGVSQAWPPGPEAQEAAARALVEKYWNKYGDWRQVSAAWYAGEGWADKHNWSRGRANQSYNGDGYPAIASYANSVVARMEGVGSDDDAMEGTATGSPPTEEDIVAMIEEQFPDYAFLLNDPEVRAILLEASDPQGGLDEAVFMSRVRQTEWYQNHGNAARAWDVLINTDPATAKRNVEQATARLRAQATQLGVQLTESELLDLAERSLRFGFSEIEITAELATLLVGDEPMGAVQGTLLQLRSLSNDYLVKLSENELIKWAQQIVTGQATVQDFQKAAIGLAKAKFNGNSQMTGMLDEGTSPEAFFREHKSLIASEWDLATEQVNLMDEQWNNVLQTEVDGTIRPMTLAETRRHMRMMEGWDQTTIGKRKSAEMGLELLTKMGMVAI